MGMYTSFKIVAFITREYRSFFSKILQGPCGTCNDCKTYKECKLHAYLMHLYCSDGFFEVTEEYNEDTGVLVCGTSLKPYGNIRECCENEIDFCIKRVILPYGSLTEYYIHQDDLCEDCICNPQDFPNECEYVNKYKHA